MECKNEHLLDILLFYSRKGKELVEQRSGQHIEVDDDQIKVLIEDDHHKTVPRWRLNVSHTKIENNLKCFGFAKKFDIWILTTYLLNTTNSYLLTYNETESFLKKIITGDRKWVIFTAYN